MKPTTKPQVKVPEIIDERECFEVHQFNPRDKRPDWMMSSRTGTLGEFATLAEAKALLDDLVRLWPWCDHRIAVTRGTLTIVHHQYAPHPDDTKG